MARCRGGLGGFYSREVQSQIVPQMERLRAQNAILEVFTRIPALGE